MTSIGTALRAENGVGPGFNVVRIALSMGVLLVHCQLMLHGADGYAQGAWRFPTITLVPMFFALSGFLVTASAQRLTLGRFVLNRFLRIVPALVVEVVVSALILGPLFTSERLGDYLRGRELTHYFRNIVGLVHYTLPGVFLDNPFPATVNGSLWTVPFEIGCYVLMAGLVAAGLLHRRLVLAIALVAAAALAMAVLPLPPSSGLVRALGPFGGARGPDPYFYFVGGCLCFLYRDAIPRSRSLFAGCVAAYLWLSFSGHPLLDGSAELLVCLPVLTYIVVFLGLQRLPSLPLYRRGDYSYGVYLYGFPLQQALVASFPGRFDGPTLFAASVVLATAFAAVSWHCIEHPILRRRRTFGLVPPDAAASLGTTGHVTAR